MYFSTRSGTGQASFEDVVMRGLAPDGGLYIPSEIPNVSQSTLKSWANLDFAKLAVEIFSLYIPESEVSRKDLESLATASYKTFREPEVTPVRELNKEKQLYLLELFHGPTFAFKDVALQFLGNLFEFFLVRQNQGKPESPRERNRVTVIGATSGDTGSAAIYGLRGKKDVSVFILYPKGRVSAIQEQQMTTVLDKNVHTIQVPGTFDDCQDIVKEMFADAEFNKEYHVGAVNSINWARILAQITYYFKTYLSLVTVNPDAKIKFVVPTGNFGDVLAGYYAKRMGLPAELVVATNENDILYRFLTSGTYLKDGQVHATHSPAMDILVSSNFERFLWHAARDTVASSDAEAAALVKEWMHELKQHGQFTVPPEVYTLAKSTFGAQHTSDEETLTTIANVYNDLAPGYILDPHSAVAVSAALLEREHKNDSSHYVALSTAHPAKFSDAVSEALKDTGYSHEEVLPAEIKSILRAESKKLDVDSRDRAAVRNLIVKELEKEWSM